LINSIETNHIYLHSYLQSFQPYTLSLRRSRYDMIMIWSLCSFRDGLFKY